MGPRAWIGRVREHGVLAVVFAVTILMGLGGTMLNVALPAVVRDLDATATQANWIILSYMVVYTAVLVPSGQISDAVDKRRAFLIGIAVVIVTSVVLALAPGPEVVIVARAVQGIAAALLLSNAAAIIALSYDGAALARAMGIYLAGFAVAQASGPVVGGLLAGALGWRSIFVVTVGIGAVALAAGWRLLRRLPTRARRPLHFDLPGNLVVAASVGALIFGLSSAQGRGFGDPLVLVLLGAALLLLPVLWLVEQRQRHPAVEPELMRDRVFSVVNAASLCLIVPRVVPVVVLSLWLQGVDGFTTAEAGLLVTALPATVALGSVSVRRMTGDRSDTEMGFWTALGCAVACTALVPAVLWGPVWSMVLVLLAVGWTTGLYSTVSATTLVTRAPRERAASVNGIRTTFQMVGMAGGTAAMLALVTVGLSPSQATAFMGGRHDQLSAGSVSAVHAGYLAALGLMALLAWVATGLSAWVRRPE